MSKLREHLDDCERYKTFLDDLTPEEYFQTQAQEKIDRATERMETKRGEIRGEWEKQCTVIQEEWEKQEAEEAKKAAEEEAKEREEAAKKAAEKKAAEEAGKKEGKQKPEPNEMTEEQKEQAKQTKQWLHKIPDDSAGLWRRKFQYQYRLRQPAGASSGGQEQQAW